MHLYMYLNVLQNKKLKKIHMYLVFVVCLLYGFQIVVGILKETKIIDAVPACSIALDILTSSSSVMCACVFVWYKIYAI